MRQKTLDKAVSLLLILGIFFLPVGQAFCADQRRPYIPGTELPTVAASFGAARATTLSAEGSYVTRYLLQRSSGALRTGLPQLKGDVFEAIWQYRNNVRLGTPEYLPTKSTVAPHNDMMTIRRTGGYGPAAQLKSGSTRYIVREMLNSDTRAERFIVPDDQYDDVIAALRKKATMGQISQARLERELRRLERGGITNEQLQQETRKAIQHLRLVKTIRWPLLIGVRQAAFAGMLAAPLMGGANAIMQWARAGEVDWSESATFGAIGGTGAFVGTWAGAQTQWLLMTKPAQNIVNAALGSKLMLTVCRLGGFAAATLVTSALVSYGLYFAGQISLKEANRTMVATGVGGVAALVITGGAVWIVGTFGAASTGAAISSLSGAAASNAILAWFGGGSVAAGGGGVAAGAAVLTGIGIVVFFVGVGGSMLCYKWKDAKENRDRIAFLLDRAGERIAGTPAPAR